MIFATDLDRTMIYSGSALGTPASNYTCIETKENTVISYIDNNTLNRIKELLNAKEYLVVPTTTRSIEQFNRVKYFRDFEWAITTNGGTILHFGEVFEPWKNITDNIIEKYDLDYAYMLLKSFDEIEKEPRIVDNRFVYSVSNDTELTENKLNNLLNDTDWNFTIQGRKVYIIPKEITKSNAIKFIQEITSEDFIVAAGDGKLDIDMLEYANRAITPKHGEIFERELFRGYNLECIGYGVSASRDILKYVDELYTKR